MIKSIKRLVLAWAAPEMLEEVSRLRGILAVWEHQVTTLKDELESVEEDRRRLLDWALSTSGAPPLYSDPPPKQVKAPVNTLAGKSRAGDWAAAATALENEAFLEEVRLKR